MQVRVDKKLSFRSGTIYINIISIGLREKEGNYAVSTSCFKFRVR